MGLVFPEDSEAVPVNFLLESMAPQHGDEFSVPGFYGDEEDRLVKANVIDESHNIHIGMFF